MIAFCEETARSIPDGSLSDGQTPVGSFIEFQHLAATPVGMKVTVAARLAEVDGRRLRFDIEASDEVEMVGRGTHERFVIDRDRFESRLGEKRTPLT